MKIRLMRPRRPRPIAAAGLVTAALLVAGCASSATPSASSTASSSATVVHVKVAELVNNIFDASVLIAQQEGYYRKEGLDITFGHFSTGTTAVDALLTNSVNIAVMAVTPFMTTEVKTGNEYVGVGVSDYLQNGQSIVVRKGEHITSVAGLKGKKIGLYVGSSTWLDTTGIALPDAGLKPGDYTVVNLPSTGLVSALSTGAIDAFASSDPEPLLAVADGSGTILQGLGKYDPQPAVVVTSKSYLSHNASTVQKFLQATMMADKLIQTNLPAATSDLKASFAKNGVKQSTAEVGAQLKAISAVPYFRANVDQYFTKIGGLLVKSGKISSAPSNLGALINTGPLKAAGKAMNLPDPYSG